MRRIFLLILLLMLSYLPGYCDSPSIQVDLTTPKSEISFNEYEVPINIKITNTGADDVQFPDLASGGANGFPAEYRIHLVTEDSGAFELNLNQLDSGAIPMITLKQGESYSKSMDMRIRSGRPGTAITFKVGFKLLENSTPVWSNPATIRIGNIENRD